MYDDEVRKTLSIIFTNSVWSKVAAVIVILFFVRLSDAILSDWVPVYMQTTLGSPMVMGLVMSFSSIVGLGADFIFPQLLRGMIVRKLMLFAVLSSVLFSAILYLSTYAPFIVIFLVAMAVWGVYYEFLGFANQQFVAETVDIKQRSAVWGIMGVFGSLAYFLGPILGALLLTRGNQVVVITAGIIAFVAYILLLIFKTKSKPVEIVIEKINFRAEAEHWRVLFAHVWPMLLASLVLGLIDATFWTTGTVLTESMAQKSFRGGR